MTYLYIYASVGRSMNPLDYVDFTVYDSAEDAIKMYNSLYEDCKEYDSGLEEGENWFVSKLRPRGDAGTRSVYCLQDNVVISAEIAIWSCWVEPDSETKHTTEQRVRRVLFDRSTLREYVIENAPELKDYVMEDILGY